MKITIPKMIEKWEKKIGVKANEFGIKKYGHNIRIKTKDSE